MEKESLQEVITIDSPAFKDYRAGEKMRKEGTAYPIEITSIINELEQEVSLSKMGSPQRILLLNALKHWYNVISFEYSMPPDIRTMDIDDVDDLYVQSVKRIIDIGYELGDLI